MERRNESQIGVTKVGIVKKILLPFDNRMLMTIHINMKNYDLTFFFSFISAFVPSPIIMFPKLDLISILILPVPDLPS